MDRLSVVKQRARHLLEDIPSERTYHNQEHVERMVTVAHDIGVEHGLSETELELLETAGWFHDLGYTNGPADGHEKRSQDLVNEHLSDLFSPSELERINTAIAATEWPQKPVTEIGEVLADADVHTLGTENAERVRETVFEELRQTDYPDLSREEFFAARVEMFSDHTYHTQVARDRYQSQKDNNIERLRQRK